ncbi:hypothetical protein BDV12DRAFT_89398 [Aspergillus spectabilis]
MVYPGGPSRGCYTCRARKIKCDETKPVCKRCVKGNRTCGGYRVLDKKTIPTHQKLEAQPLGYLSTFPDTILGQSGQLELDSLSTFYGQLGLLPQVQSLHGGFLTTIPTLLASLKQPEVSPVSQALSALLLCFVADRQNGEDHGALTGAMAYYGNALQLTRQLIEGRNPERTIEFIMTIFVLSVFCEGTQSAKCLRTISVEIFILRCWLELYFRFHPCGASIAPRCSIRGYKTNVRAIHACTLLIIQLQLRQLEDACFPIAFDGAAAAASIANTATKANVFLKSVAVVETQMSEWENPLPPKLRYMTIQLPLDDSIDLWTTEAHIYPKFSAGNDWAGYRTPQILGHGLRLRAYRLLAKPLYDYDNAECGHRDSPLASLASDIAMTHSKIRALTTDICASMPFHLGYRTKLESGIRYPSEPFPNGDFPRLMSACHIMWPLYLAGIAEGVDVPQRLWISRQLDLINSEMKIRKAAVLAELIRREAVLEVQELTLCRVEVY